MTGSSFVWYELMSSDVPAAKAFYADVVGWSAQDMPMPGTLPSEGTGSGYSCMR